MRRVSVLVFHSLGDRGQSHLIQNSAVARVIEQYLGFTVLRYVLLLKAATYLYVFLCHQFNQGTS